MAGLAYSYCDPGFAASVIIGTGCDKAANWTSISDVTAGTSATTVPAIGVIPVVLTNGSVGLAFDDEIGTQTCTGTNPTDNSCLSPSGTDIAWTVIPGADTVAHGTPLPIADNWVDIAPYDSSGITKQRAGSLPQAAVDPNTDEVYITWESNRFRSATSQNQNDAVVIYATDPGTGTPGILPSSWSSPVQVDPETPSSLIDDYNPTIAIGSDSILRVAYRSRNEGASFDPSTGLGTPIDTYYQEAPTGSTVTGSFSAPLKVDTVQGTPDASFGAFSRSGLFEGDYDQIAAAPVNDVSYVARDEAFPLPSGPATCSTNFSTIPTTPCQNQQQWDALIAPQAAVNTPDVRFVPALVFVGTALGFFVLRRRRRSQPAES